MTTIQTCFFVVFIIELWLKCRYDAKVVKKIYFINLVLLG